MTSPTSLIQRVLIAAGFIVAFVFMASIFSPAALRAGQDAPDIARPLTVDAMSHTTTDAHAGLAALGEIQTNQFTIRIFSTSVGPRYSITDRRSGESLATLMSADDVTRFFPEIPLSEIEFDAQHRTEGASEVAASRPLMMADTPSFDH